MSIAEFLFQKKIKTKYSCYIFEINDKKVKNLLKNQKFQKTYRFFHLYGHNLKIAYNESTNKEEKERRGETDGNLRS